MFSTEPLIFAPDIPKITLIDARQKKVAFSQLNPKVIVPVAKARINISQNHCSALLYVIFTK